MCYFTGRDVHKALNKSVPIGLVESDWGGTRVEAWSPPSALVSCSTDNTTVCEETEQNACSVL